MDANGSWVKNKLKSNEIYIGRNNLPLENINIRIEFLFNNFVFNDISP